MNVLWCWRCREDVPMLDDDEWALIMRAHQHWDDPERSLAVINAERATRGLTPLKPEPMERHPTQHRCWRAINCSPASRNPIPMWCGITSALCMDRHATRAANRYARRRRACALLAVHRQSAARHRIASRMRIGEGVLDCPKAATLPLSRTLNLEFKIFAGGLCSQFHLESCALCRVPRCVGECGRSVSDV